MFGAQSFGECVISHYQRAVVYFTVPFYYMLSIPIKQHPLCVSNCSFITELFEGREANDIHYDSITEDLHPNN